MLFWRILHGATCLVGCLELLASALEFLDAIQVLFSLTDSVASSLFLFWSMPKMILVSSFIDP